mmetsp:Transcript_11628/g.15761  ORF Transcript_11628/g.15761 Transcript_11628/m.15761 type:complete len:99 (+) Transcript_11628:962-1258(+)
MNARVTKRGRGHKRGGPRDALNKTVITKESSRRISEFFCGAPQSVSGVKENHAQGQEEAKAKPAPKMNLNDILAELDEPLDDHEPLSVEEEKGDRFGK